MNACMQKLSAHKNECEHAASERQVIALTSRPWSCRKNEATGLPKTSQRTE
jgi:hypothetical protein